MTAAHCVHSESGKKLPADSLQVRLGVFDRENPNETSTLTFKAECFDTRQYKAASVLTLSQKMGYIQFSGPGLARMLFSNDWC